MQFRSFRFGAILRRNAASEDLMPDSPRIALVIGITGGIGGAAAAALARHGWQIRALSRNPDLSRRAIDWRRGDAMNEADVVAAAKGVRLIVHAANPPQYRNWRGLAIPMLRAAIAAAQASGARLTFPGNVYNFGPDAGAVVTEASPQHPLTRKGAIRVEMEGMLAAAAKDGVRSLIVRAGDYFGGYTPSSWFQNALVAPGRPLRKVTYPGAPAVGHAWAYLPDLAEAIARLADVEERLAPSESVHFAGHWLERGIEMAEAIRRAAGNPDLPIRRFPWAAIYLAAPFVPLLREMLEMRYLWRQPLRLRSDKLAQLIGPEPHTPLDEAVRQSLMELGCRPETAGTETLSPA
jgi:nucleoside-diphosphate-sugar epimerase